MLGTSRVRDRFRKHGGRGGGEPQWREVTEPQEGDVSCRVAGRRTEPADYRSIAVAKGKDGMREGGRGMGWH